MKIESDGDGLFTLQLAKQQLQTIAAACQVMAYEWGASKNQRSRDAAVELNHLVSSIVTAVLTTTGKTNEAINLS